MTRPTFRDLGTPSQWAADLLGGVLLIGFFLAVFFVLGVTFDTPDAHHIVLTNPAQTFHATITTTEQDQ